MHESPYRYTIAPLVSRMLSLRLQRTLLTIAFLCCYSFLFVTTMLWVQSHYNAWPPSGLVDMVEGRAEKPYVYRTLLPSIVRVLYHASSESDRIATGEFLIQTGHNVENYTGEIFKKYRIKKVLPTILPDQRLQVYLEALTALVTCFFLVGYLVGLFLLAKELFKETLLPAYIAPIIGLVFIPAWGVLYIYDIPALMLWTVCLYKLCKQHYIVYFLCFILAIFAKETSFYLIIVYAVWSYNKLPRNQFLLLLAWQLVAFLTIKLSINYAYLANPGGVLKFFQLHQQILQYYSGQLLPHMLAWAATFFLLTHHWQEKPYFLRCASWVIPLHYVLIKLFTLPHEWRNYYEIYPVALLLLLHTLICATGFEKALVFKSLRRDHT